LKQQYPQTVVDFCAQHAITDKLAFAVELVNETLPDAESVTVELEQDPDSQQRWVLVNARVAGKAREVRLRHRDCVRRLLSTLQWPAATLLRTTYTLV
jgi:hypothetical protein